MDKKFIEGPWNEIFEFRMIKPEDDLTDILKHLQKCFYHSTPLMAGLTRSQAYLDEFDKVYKTIIPQGLSFYVVDTRTNQIVGTRITYIQTKKVDEAIANHNFKTEQMKNMNLIMGTVNREANLYERYGIDSFVNFFTASVDPIYQGQGIATEMYERALRAVRANKDYHYVKSNLTSPYTRRICYKYGFEELARAYFNDFKDANGNPILVGRGDDEFVTFACLKLQ